MNTENLKGALLWVIIGGTIGGLLGMWVGYTLGNQSPSIDGDKIPVADVQNSSDDPDGSGVLIGTQASANGDGALLTIVDQPAGYAVIVAHLELPKSGWVAVHEVLPGDIIGNVLGAVRRDTGSYDAVVVDLLRATESGSSYAVVLYADNGNKEFDIRADIPITREDGTPIVERFAALLPVSPSGR